MLKVIFPYYQEIRWVEEEASLKLPTNKAQLSQEQKLTDKLKEEYDKRVADYSKVTKILLGIQRKFITAKDILNSLRTVKKGYTGL